MRFETHAHSHYSNIRLIDAITKPETLLLTASKLGYSGITLTDHEALCGHVEWLELEKKFKEEEKLPKDFKCGLGNEIYLTNDRTPQQKYYHYILIAKNTEGHRALRELSSNAWLNSYRYRGMERVPTLKTELEEIINKYPNSLIALNACIGGELGQLVLNLINAEKSQSVEEIESTKLQIDTFMRWNIDLFGNDFYIEIAPGTSKDQIAFNKRIKPIVDFYKRKMVVATDAHYPTVEDRQIHKSFLNSKNGEREVDSFYYDAHLMNDDEAYGNIKDIYSHDEFQKMCDNSLEIMNKIESYDIFHQPIIPEVKVECGPAYEDNSIKDYPTLFNLRKSDNPQERAWVNKCLMELKLKNIDDKIHMDRLELEASILSYISEKLNNCMYSYFNTFQHYIDLFWDCGSVVGPGRGSAGSFLSNYLLGITQINPVEWELPYFRFLNKDRAELPDIDIDLAPSKRPLILKRIREERGELNVVQVATFGTTSSRAAIATACRGYRAEDCPDGVDVDIAQYMSSLVPSERGLTWSLSDCINGNEEKDRKPIKELVNQFNQYPGLLEIAFGIEDLIVRRGQHASGLMLYNESPYNTTALMRSPNGDITTQFDLHKSELLGDVKFDFLVTDICDKISVAIELLTKDGYFKECKSKREIYNNYFHPQKIDLTDTRLWDGLASGEVQDCFQFNTNVGLQAARAIKPRNPTELTSANGLMRLVAPEGQERPFDRYVRFKSDISLWYKEMDEFGLTKQEQKLLEPYYLKNYGVPCDQESLMRLVMDEKISHFTLAESNATRKVLAKKQVKKIPEVKQKFLSQCPSPALGAYAWRTMMEPQMSYSFSSVHALLYSFIGIQTLVLATTYPSIYWNTACLIVNSQSIPDEDEEEYTEPDEIIVPITAVEDDEDGTYEYEDLPDRSGKIKKKVKTPDYGRIASAIGKIKFDNITVSSPAINTSSYTFSPNVEDNLIRYGLSGITRVGDDLIKSIIAGRPYESLEDFLNRIKINKLQMISLIKSGAFDEFGERVEIMEKYLDLISDKKKRLTLQNVKMLMDYNLIPDDLDFERRVFNYNKYLKKLKLDDTYYGMDEIAFSFYEKNFDVDKLTVDATCESGFKIKQTIWDKIYKDRMEKIKSFIKSNHDSLLSTLNGYLIDELREKYCKGSISYWEMCSVSCYFHPHELEDISNLYELGIDKFSDLPEEPEIERVVNIKGKQVPLFKISRIAGTVLDKNKMKKTITLLTTDGVVTVKLYGEAYSNYDRQISVRGDDGKKTILEKSWFQKGNKIILTGIRRDQSDFICKKYKSTPYHLVELITKIEDGEIKETQKERLEV